MGYSAQVAGALLFLLVITLDGVDGELARLKMQETDFGATLDLVTDAFVNMLLVLGVILGCYRAGGSRAYLYLLPLFVGGFALCAIASHRMVRFSVDNSPRLAWLVERLTSRDFAYLLLFFALFDRLAIVAWGADFGSYVVAALLMWAASQVRLNRIEPQTRSRPNEFPPDRRSKNTGPGLREPYPRLSPQALASVWTPSSGSRLSE